MTLCPGRGTTHAAFQTGKHDVGHLVASPGNENRERSYAARATDTTSDARSFQDLKETVIETREIWEES